MQNRGVLALLAAAVWCDVFFSIDTSIYDEESPTKSAIMES